MTDTKTQSVCGAVENEVSSDKTTAQEAFEALFRFIKIEECPEYTQHNYKIVKTALEAMAASEAVTDVEALKRGGGMQPASTRSALKDEGWNDCLDYLNQRGLIATGWREKVVPGTGNPATVPLIARTVDEDGNKVVILAEWYYEGLINLIDDEALPPKTDKQGQSDE